MTALLAYKRQRCDQSSFFPPDYVNCRPERIAFPKMKKGTGNLASLAAGADGRFYGNESRHVQSPFSVRYNRISYAVL
jgi:hypothetical protein